MHRDTSRSADDLNRPEGNDLVSNYEHHDVGEAYIKWLFDSYNVIDWGIDKRHDDNGLIFDNKMDFIIADMNITVEVNHKDEIEVSGNTDVCGIIDVKTKTSDRWMRRYNRRHHDKYYDIAEIADIPVYVVFCEVDGDEVVDVDCVPLHKHEREECYTSEFHFPDGNRGVYIPVENCVDVDEMYEDITGI